jgi:hypothetical protein
VITGGNTASEQLFRGLVHPRRPMGLSLVQLGPPWLETCG